MKYYQLDIAETSIEGSIRLSMGARTSEEDILGFEDKFKIIYEEIKELLK